MRSHYLSSILCLASALSANALVTNQSNHLTTSEEALQNHIRKVIPNSKSFPYWGNVGRVHLSTGIYLGNGYVLTAAHVGPGTFLLSDGSEYPVVRGSAAVYRNADNSQTELCIFKVESRRKDSLRKLPSINIRSTPPDVGELILMIGHGASQYPGDTKWVQDGKKRWGCNLVSRIARQPFANSFGQTHGYYTRFDHGLFDCQGASGDSGGPAFYYDQEQQEWLLTGMLAAVTTPVHLEETKHGDSTFIADLRPMLSNPIKIIDSRLESSRVARK